MIFALDASEVPEIGTICVLLHQAAEMLSQVVIQMIRLYSEAWAMLEEI